MKNILAYLLTSKAYFVLAEDGVLAEGKNVVCQAYSKGWNCMTRVSEYELALGSFEGEVIVVSWK